MQRRLRDARRLIVAKPDPIVVRLPDRSEHAAASVGFLGSAREHKPH